MAIEDGRLLRKSDLKTSEVDWRSRAIKSLESRLLDPGYPCYFATSAWKDDRLGVGFFRRGQVVEAVAILQEFSVVSASSDTTRLGLILVEEPHSDPAHVEYFDLFWGFLNDIHRSDGIGWPSNREKDAHLPEWMFVFEGTPYFVIGMAPSYPTSSSRNLPESLAMVFIPQSAFNGIERETEAGKACRVQIADRLRAYEGVGIAQALDQTMTDAVAWRAYFLEGDTPRAACPFKVNYVIHRGRRFVIR